MSRRDTTFTLSIMTIDTKLSLIETSVQDLLTFALWVMEWSPNAKDGIGTIRASFKQKVVSSRYRKACVAWLAREHHPNDKEHLSVCVGTLGLRFRCVDIVMEWHPRALDAQRSRHVRVNPNGGWSTPSWLRQRCRTRWWSHTAQCSFLLARRRRGRMLEAGQRGVVRHLLPYSEAHDGPHTKIWSAGWWCAPDYLTIRMTIWGNLQSVSSQAHASEFYRQEHDVWRRDPDTSVIWQLRHSSETACPRRRFTSRCVLSQH